MSTPVNTAEAINFISGTISTLVGKAEIPELEACITSSNAMISTI